MQQTLHFSKLRFIYLLGAGLEANNPHLSLVFNSTYIVRNYAQKNKKNHPSSLFFCFFFPVYVLSKSLLPTCNCLTSLNCFSFVWVFQVSVASIRICFFFLDANMHLLDSLITQWVMKLDSGKEAKSQNLVKHFIHSDSK